MDRTTPTPLDPQRAAIESAVEWLVTLRHAQRCPEWQAFVEWLCEWHGTEVVWLFAWAGDAVYGGERDRIDELNKRLLGWARSYVVSRGEAWLAEWVGRHRPALGE